MSVEKTKIESIFSQLPEEAQGKVLEFAESLLRKEADGQMQPRTSLESVFGIWESGDPHSADNDKIDRDLANEYSNAHKND